MRGALFQFFESSGAYLDPRMVTLSRFYKVRLYHQQLSIPRLYARKDLDWLAQHDWAPQATDPSKMGSFKDMFGVQWMVNYTYPKKK